MLRVIAIDGPAASGKSSTAGLVAERLGWAHLDSGALYRALTLAALPEVRTWVITQQRQAVEGMEVVVDGRDIGTVVFPEAPLKIFLTATPDERARRRLSQRGQAVDGDLMRRESQELAARDAADSTRAIAPLKPAPDAVLLDTTTLTLEQQVTGVVELARGLFPG